MRSRIFCIFILILSCYGDRVPVNSVYSPVNPVSSDGGLSPGIAARLLGTADVPKNLTGNGVTVAVVDSGLFTSHEVFGNNGIGNYGNLTSDCRIIGYYDAFSEYHNISPSPYPTDQYGHGTHVSSIIGGNSSVFKGLAPDVRFVVVKVFNVSYNPETGKKIYNTSTAIIEKGLRWIIENGKKYGIKFVQISFGNRESCDGSDVISKLVDRLAMNGILPVIAVGNRFFAEAGIGSPACSFKGLTVGASDYSGHVLSLSARGPTTDGRIKPDVIAPGYYIKGAYIGTYNNYIALTGTSQAAPFITGLAVLAYQYSNKTLTSAQLKQLISMSARPAPGSEGIRDNTMGWGIPKLGAVLDYLNSAVLKPKVGDKIIIGLNGSYYSHRGGVWFSKIAVKKNSPMIVSLNFSRAYLVLYSSNYSEDSYEPIIIDYTEGGIITLSPEKDTEYYLAVKLAPEIGDFITIGINFSEITFFPAVIFVNIGGLCVIYIIMSIIFGLIFENGRDDGSRSSSLGQ